MQSYNQVRCKLSVGQHRTDIGQVQFIPEGRAISTVIQQNCGNILTLLQGLIQALSLN